MTLSIDEVKASWEPLCTTEEQCLARGAVLRYPLDGGLQDLMIVEHHDGQSGWALMKSTGYKAGILLVVLPSGSHHSQQPGISTAWLVQHWSEWVDMRSRAEDVLVAADGYVAVRQTQ
jgi:hypothetical protein